MFGRKPPQPAAPTSSGAPPPSLVEAVRDALRTVNDPELHKDLVTLGMIKTLTEEHGNVHVNVELTTPACPLKDQIEREVRAAVGRVPGVKTIDLAFSSRVRGSATPGAGEPIPGIRNIVAVASGKGGVGKSTVATNIAAALAETGARTGILDADIFGPSVAKMLGLAGSPRQRGNKIEPFTVSTGTGELRVMSMAFFLDENQPIIWRGPMLHKALHQLLHDVAWGELDYLVLDLPPGTGDVQISLAQLVPIAGAVIVTTPQDVALLDVRKAVAMFRKVNVRILGVIENMSSFTCPSCSTSHAIFGTGGGRDLAASIDVPLLGEIPLEPLVRVGGDGGRPVVLSHPDSPAARAMLEAARRLAGQVSLVASEGSYAVELPVLR